MKKHILNINWTYPPINTRWWTLKSGTKIYLDHIKILCTMAPKGYNLIEKVSSFDYPKNSFILDCQGNLLVNLEGLTPYEIKDIGIYDPAHEGFVETEYAADGKTIIKHHVSHYFIKNGQFTEKHELLPDDARYSLVTKNREKGLGCQGTIIEELLIEEVTEKLRKIPEPELKTRDMRDTINAEATEERIKVYHEQSFWDIILNFLYKIINSFQ